MLREILAKIKEYIIDTYHLFVDFKVAFDWININKLFEEVCELGIPLKHMSDQIYFAKCQMSK